MEKDGHIQQDEEEDGELHKHLKWAQTNEPRDTVENCWYLSQFLSLSLLSVSRAINESLVSHIRHALLDY